MLGNIIKFLLGRESQPAPRSDHVDHERLLDTMAPEIGEGVTAPRSFVCREPVMDHAQHVSAYEFLLQKQSHQSIRNETRATLRLYDEVLLRNVIAMDIGRLLGTRQAFIGISSCCLGSPLLDELPRAGVVLALKLFFDKGDDAAEILRRVAALKQQGFGIAIDDFSGVRGLEAVLPLVDFVRLDVSAFDSLQLSHEVAALHHKAPGVEVMAKNLISLEDMEVCRKMQFHLFQGPYLTRREDTDQPRMDTSRMRVFQLLNLLRREADTGELSQVFKYDPMLTYKLLRYINSPGVGLVTKVTSVEHALVVLGHKKLYRWLTLLLFSSGKVDPRDWALMESALVRARLAESLGRGTFSPPECDELFVTGVFSLLDTLLKTPMGKVVGQLSLPEAVGEALVSRTGKYAPYLELAEACEAFDLERIAKWADACGLDINKVNAAQVDALVWAQEIER